jgi:radical SAM superfamily enzyme YgiQ (UPF0313 family)
MKFLFIIPPIDKKILHGEWDLSQVDSISPPLGVLILTAVLKKNGYEAGVIDAYAENLTINDIIEKIIAYNPEAVGLSFMTPAFESAISLAQAIKKQLPHIYIVAGGAHATAAPEETLACQAIDSVVIGEGEETLLDLLDKLSRREIVQMPNGMAFRDIHGVARRTEKRNFIQHMDALPLPDWGAINLKHYRLSPIGTKGRFALPLITSRGCPCRCTFCDTGGVGPKIRGYSAEYVIGMIDHLMVNYGINDFLIYDDNFVALKPRLKQICEEIIKREWRIYWSCCARVDMVDKELLKLMRAAGCWQIEYGIESGSQKMLDLMKKRIRLQQVEQALEWTKQAGIETRGNFILGFLGETKETLEETVQFALKVDLDYFQQTFLTPYPGSEIYHEAEKYGKFDKSFERMNNLTINFIPHGLTKAELQYYSSRAFRKFYLRPKIILHHLKKIRRIRDIRRLMIAFVAFMKTILRERFAQ